MRSRHTKLHLLSAVLTLCTLGAGPLHAQDDGPPSEEVPEAAASQENGDEEEEPGGWQATIDSAFADVNEVIGDVFFAPVPIPLTGKTVAFTEFAEGSVRIEQTAQHLIDLGRPAPKVGSHELSENQRVLTLEGADFPASGVREGDLVRRDDGALLFEVALSPVQGEDSSARLVVVVPEDTVGAPGPAEEVRLDGLTVEMATKTVPFTVLWLVLGAVYFTLRMRFINFRAFKHAIDVVRGRFDSPEDQGEVSSFQALTTALSATVGLGNIASVTIAVCTGGPGAIFWMVLAGVLGMSSKFTECTLGQMYRETRPDGRLMGGAMHYLSKGLSEQGLGGLGKFLAVFFAILCIGGSLAGGNAFQANQSLRAVQEQMPFFVEYDWVYGLIMTFFVAIVIIGGLRRIAAAAERIVPTMCTIYVLAALFILISNAEAIPAAVGLIVGEAFKLESAYGGLIGVLVYGFQRAAFSNEAGIGSAAIAHSAARVPHPAREGIVALLEPFIDTVIICTMTGLVIVVTGAYDTTDPRYAELIADKNGAAVTSRAFGSVISWFPWILAIAVMLFAYSTMISWSYYGERCWAWMFGDKSSMIYRVIFLFFVFAGSVISATQALEFGDLMILGMALPNILGVVLLSNKVKAGLDDYLTKLRNGEYRSYK